MFVISGEAGTWATAVVVLGGALAAADLIFRTTTSRHHHHREEGQVAAALRLSLMCSGIPMSATLLSSISSPAVALVFSFSLRFSDLLNLVAVKDVDVDTVLLLNSCNKTDVQFLPISGLCGANMKTRMDKSICSWWDGPCLFEVLDRIEVPLRDPRGPVRMPIIDKYKDMGTVVMGKLESGTIREGDSLLVMPNKSNVKVIGINLDEKKVRRAGPGENVRVKLSGIEEDDIMAGFVLSSIGYFHCWLQGSVTYPLCR
ncbi:eukaryotic peptide chain release factor GTP-binding subunit ERF3A-like [Lolium rigidum]|uniref:eukaryotic peptide chain release factor GTP-binding subunit ERF3A-like n=1 Tax=Lolium rigidum TaxID=89674 RepID=UPI001F5CF360|nr:eukaryotic peptide chain release factor GTP-binding subunit ERF3A-like [Lolium rigidum]